MITNTREASSNPMTGRMYDGQDVQRQTEMMNETLSRGLVKFKPLVNAEPPNLSGGSELGELGVVAPPIYGFETNSERLNNRIIRTIKQRKKTAKHNEGSVKSNHRKQSSSFSTVPQIVSEDECKDIQPLEEQLRSTYQYFENLKDNLQSSCERRIAAEIRGSSWQVEYDMLEERFKNLERKYKQCTDEKKTLENNLRDADHTIATLTVEIQTMRENTTVVDLIGIANAARERMVRHETGLRLEKEEMQTLSEGNLSMEAEKQKKYAETPNHKLSPHATSRDLNDAYIDDESLLNKISRTLPKGKTEDRSKNIFFAKTQGQQQIRIYSGSSESEDSTSQMCTGDESEWSDEEGEGSVSTDFESNIVFNSSQRNVFNQVMRSFWSVYNREYTLIVSQCATVITAGATESSGSGSNQKTTGPFRSPFKSDIQKSSSKRGRYDGDEIPEEDNNDRSPKRQTPDSASHTDGKIIIKYACPFRKHNPRKYNLHDQDHKTCALSSFESVARLKEHLYRRHRTPIQCVRCWLHFDNQINLNTHLAVTDTCELHEGFSTEGMTHDMEKKIRSRKKAYRDQTEDDRWKDIYGVLFPDEAIPSPYYEGVLDHLAESRNFLQLPIEEHLRQELPRIFASLLAVEISQAKEGSIFDNSYLGDRFVSRMTRLVTDAQETAISTYSAILGKSREESVPARLWEYRIPLESSNNSGYISQKQKSMEDIEKIPIVLNLQSNTRNDNIGDMQDFGARFSESDHNSLTSSTGSWDAVLQNPAFPNISHQMQSRPDEDGNSLRSLSDSDSTELHVSNSSKQNLHLNSAACVYDHNCSHHTCTDFQAIDGLDAGPSCPLRLANEKNMNVFDDNYEFNWENWDFSANISSDSLLGS